MARLQHTDPSDDNSSGVVIPLRPGLVPPSDAALVEAAVGGDARAKEQLYRRHAPMVFGLAHRVLGRREDVDDLVQDAFMQAFERLHKLRDGQAFAAWINTIVVRAARSRIRRLRLARRFGLDQREELDTERLVSAHASPEIRAELTTLYGLLERLPANVRIALVLRRVEGLTIPEISQHMGLSTATVKRHIKAGEVLLAGQLRRGGNDHAAAEE